MNALKEIPQIEESKILNFERSEVAVGFFIDICMEDLKTLKKYYEKARDNSIYQRLQNTMRVRQNDKYLNSIEQEIARLENRWVVPIMKATNIFESAVQFTDVPQDEIKDKGVADDQDIRQADIQSRKRWIDEPAVVQLKAAGVRPYREAYKRLRQLRHRRSQYKYLELYFLNIGRQILNLQANLRLIIAIIDVVIKARQQLGDEGLANNALGRLVKEIVSTNALDEAIEKVGKIDPVKSLGNPRQEATPASAASSPARQALANQAIPERPGGASTVGRTGLNPRQPQGR